MSISRPVATVICVIGFSFTLAAQTVQATVPVTNYPQAIALNPFTDKVYVINEPTNQVTEIDGVTNAATTARWGAGH
jgi:DNA-binding beta-propeller fold protein YncE